MSHSYTPLVQQDSLPLEKEAAKGKGGSLVQSCAGAVETPLFQSVIGGVIALNAIIIGYETDHPDFFLAPPLEQTFCVIFVSELILRLMHFGLWTFATHPEDFVWNWLDTVIVVGGVIDMWILPLYAVLAGVHFAHNKLLSLFRMMRLLRLVKLLRQLKQVQQLYDLAQAVLQATQALGWVLVLTVLFLYIFAIVCTQLIGHGNALPPSLREGLPILEHRVGLTHAGLPEHPEGAADEELQEGEQLGAYFGTVVGSMYTLFELIAGWALQPFDKLLDAVPLLKPFFLVFWIFTSWALLSVMTGAVSEGMINTKKMERDEDHDEEVAKKMRFAEKIRKLAHSIDTDGGGSIGRDEFDEMRASPHWRTLQDAAGLEAWEIQDVYDCLADSQFCHPGEEPEVPIDEFVAAFRRCLEPLTPMSLLRLDCSFRKSKFALDQELQKVEQQMISMEAVAAQMLSDSERLRRRRYGANGRSSR
mmetsp:Transcript_127974/g.292389  ORF Transcript_127974/g.292389 Transcript_127974/m.292389 type:complete len:475 (+) Transcript_127974:107-1531(+)